MRQFLLCGLVAAGALLAGAAEAQTVLRAAHSSNPGQSVYIYWDELAKAFNAKSGGKYQIQVFPSGQLGGDEQIIQGIKGGTIQLGSASNGNLGSVTDAYYWMDLPHVFKSRDGAIKALSNSGVKSYLDAKMKDDARALILGHIEVGGFRILSNKKREIRVPADLKGLKFRNLPTPIDRTLWEAWGAIPQPLAWSETFVSLEQGIIDGVNLQPQALVGFKFDDVVKHGTMTGTLMAFHVGMASLRGLEGMPDDERAHLMAAAATALAAANSADRQDEEKFVKQMEAKGIKFYRPTPEEAKQWSDIARGIWPTFQDKIDKDILNRVLAAQEG